MAARSKPGDTDARRPAPRAHTGRRAARPANAARRTRRPRAERERDILAAARAVFTERGYAGGSVAEIADRAGVVEGTVYTYFETKQALLLRVVGAFYEALIADVESGLRAIRGAEDRLRFLIARHLQVYVQDLGMCRLILSEIRPDPALYDRSIRALARRYTNVAIGVLEQGQRDGELRAEVSPLVLRDLLFGSIEHALWRHVNAGRPARIDALGAQLADAILFGIARGVPAARGADVVERLERAVATLERAQEPG